MPYITKAARDELATGCVTARNAGELNYQITNLLVQYTRAGLTYQIINDCLGALEGAKAEFYRRVAVPYEYSKLAINGDVYDRP